MLGVLAAGVGFLTVPVAESRIEPQRDVAPRRRDAQLLDHVERAAIDVNAVLDDHLQRVDVEDIGRVDDRRRITRDGIAGAHGPMDLAGADRVDQRAGPSHEIQNRQIRAGLHGVAHHVELPQVGEPFENLGRVVHVRGRAELAGQPFDRDWADLGA